MKAFVLSVASLFLVLPASAQTTPPTPAEAADLTDQAVVQPKPLEMHRCTQMSMSWIRSTPRNRVAVVGVAFQVAADGMVKDVTVSSSSGDAALDALTVSCAQKWRYAPGTKNGQPIDMPWQAQMRYWHN